MSLRQTVQRRGSLLIDLAVQRWDWVERISNDRRLSPDALGVLLFLGTRPDEWSCLRGAVSSHFKIGRHRLSRIMRELLDAGWIEARQSRAGDGAFDISEYRVIAK